jgi:hypothetical protein
VPALNLNKVVEQVSSAKTPMATAEPICDLKKTLIEKFMATQQTVISSHLKRVDEVSERQHF